MFEGEMLKIGDSVSAHLHAHVKMFVETNHGKETVDAVVPFS